MANKLHNYQDMQKSINFKTIVQKSCFFFKHIFATDEVLPENKTSLQFFMIILHYTLTYHIMYAWIIYLQMLFHQSDRFPPDHDIWHWQLSRDRNFQYFYEVWSQLMWLTQKSVKMISLWLGESRSEIQTKWSREIWAYGDFKILNYVGKNCFVLF